jgi:hypothetical protein
MDLWRSHDVSDTYTIFVTTLIPGLAGLALIINMAVGSCCPAWNVMRIVLSLVYSSLSLSSLPVSNSQISTVVSLYGDAERALDALIASASRLPQTCARRDVINSLSAHATVLLSLEKTDRLRARFLGVPVTWGLVKTLFVTLFTLGVGLWSILKGVGVFFTMQTVCPIL